MIRTLALTKCCKCCRIRVNSNWVQEPDFLSHDTAFSHTYCPTCLSEEMELAEKHADAKAPKLASSAIMQAVPA